ncbi:MAG: hypothetical protein U0802_06740 [Candidatus Binatia bacterium]
MKPKALVARSRRPARAEPHRVLKRRRQGDAVDTVRARAGGAAGVGAGPRRYEGVDEPRAPLRGRRAVDRRRGRLRRRDRRHQRRRRRGWCLAFGCADSAESFQGGLSTRSTRAPAGLRARYPTPCSPAITAPSPRRRRRESLRRTLERRPDLLEHAALSDEDRRILAELRRS